MSATMILTVGVVLERRIATSAWADVAGRDIWLPVAVLPSAPDLPPFIRLGTTATGERYFAGAVAMALHRTDTANYRDNLATGAPRIWIAARLTGGDKPVEIVGITPDPAEGESFTETGTNLVEHVPMPAEIAQALAAFVAEHHVDRPFVKRRRRDWSADAEDDQA